MTAWVHPDSCQPVHRADRLEPLVHCETTSTFTILPESCYSFYHPTEGRRLSWRLFTTMLLLLLTLILPKLLWAWAERVSPTPLHWEESVYHCTLPLIFRKKLASKCAFWGIKLKIRLLSIDVRIYSKNNPSKFHPDSIWNAGVLGCFWRGHHKNKKKKKQNKMSSDMRSDQFPIEEFCLWCQIYLR